MRIPLDYYRILGLPIQATAEQLQQAYRDRALQLPRREYSEITIAARKQLLDEAYAILCDPEQRSAYDATFLTKTYDLDSESGTATRQEGNGTADTDLDPYTPSIEIQDEQFVGALLILQELGEYELVLKLGRPFLSRASTSIEKGRLGNPQLVQPDIVLTLALACLELGREQWQQGQYENAATSLETGQELLLREGIFASLRGEIQADLYKLRPYRILELLASSEDKVTERRKGLQHLQEMLQERGGIDGTGDDQSGLNIDDFLRFIQQLRSYLTSAEQQNLFEAEARRPSAVATYLAVYALLGRGFAQRQPGLIRQAKQMLMRLGKRQDVHLEQAVCALLLGQTEEASRALELSQEYEPLAFIREHSQGAPDLLPGLCLYGERWLQAEVFPHFRDLASVRASLKDYFADDQVQAYLEELPVEEDTTNEWAVLPTQQVSYAATPVSRGTSDSPGFRRPESVVSRSSGRNGSGENGGRMSDAASSNAPLRPNAEESSSRDRLQQLVEQQSGAAHRTATMTATIDRPQTGGGSNLPAAERVSRSPEPEGNDPGLAGDSASKRQRRRGNSPEQNEQPRATIASRLRRPDSVSKASPTGGDVSARRSGGRLQRSTASLRSAKTGRLLLLGLAGLLSLGVLLMLAIAAFGWLQRSLSGPLLEGEQPMVQLAAPPVPIPEPGSKLLSPSGPLTQETARQLVQIWLASKADALGEEHSVEKLQQILADPALSRWQKRSQSTKNSNSYWKYRHKVEVKSVEMSDRNPDRAKVDAQVNEAADFYKAGKLNQASSYDESLRVRYDLVRKDSQWLIQDMKVLR
ncbi:IMS domain-containing protein [Trichocoleus sp. ST-U3]|uniref:IMS domain-containing protein n=1 Tax=Coleofasciculus sp. FACHB-542 TaxID=2692787 RepID=UPI001682582D|nr:DUF4101 domain-containing protein [Coleofasciculus sp. FACHB-542]